MTRPFPCAEARPGPGLGTDHLLRKSLCDHLFLEYLTKAIAYYTITTSLVKYNFRYFLQREEMSALAASS
jgi:hypothetical protein